MKLDLENIKVPAPFLIVKRRPPKNWTGTIFIADVFKNRECEIVATYETRKFFDDDGNVVEKPCELKKGEVVLTISAEGIPLDPAEPSLVKIHEDDILAVWEDA